MLEIINKEYLWLLVPVFLIGVFFLKTKQIKRFEVFIVFVVTVLTIFSLSRPVLSRGEHTVYKKNTEIIIMIDRSLSMGVRDYRPNRLSFALQKVIKLLDKLKDEKVGLLMFSDRVEILTFPSEKVEKAVKILKNLKIKPSGSTDILSAFSTANSILTEKERIVILVSDGSDENLAKVKELIQQSGIKLIFYGIATLQGGKVPDYNSISRLNLQMVDIAKNSGIFVKPTENDADIEAIYKYIKNISENTKTVLLKIPSKVDLSPFINAFALFIIFSGYMMRRLIFVFLLFILINPSVYAGELKGLFYYITGNYKKAAKEFFEDKKPENMYNAALLYYKIGMYNKAISILKSINTDDADLLKKVKYTTALCYLAKKDFKKAKKIGEELVSLFPEEKRIKKLYLFANFILSIKKEEKDKKTVVKVKEKRNNTFKTSPTQVGERNPW